MATNKFISRLIIATFIIFASCQNKIKTNKASASNAITSATHYAHPIKDTIHVIFDTTFNTERVTVLFNDTNGNVSILYKNKNKQKLFDIGRCCNTFGYPPNVTTCNLGISKIGIMIVSTLYTLGQSQDNLYLYFIEPTKMDIKMLCSSNDINSNNPALDTVKGIDPIFYDYHIDTLRHKLITLVYNPYQLLNDNQHKYSTITRSELFAK